MNDTIHIAGTDRKNLCGAKGFKYFLETVLKQNYPKGEYPDIGVLCKECKKIYEDKT